MANKQQLVPDLLTLDDYLQWSSEYLAAQDLFYGHGTDNPWDEAVMLALYVLQLPGENDRSALDTQLTKKQQEQLIALTHRRVQERIPVAYLTNEAWFGSERYYVNQDVIIPRSPLAELISAHFQPWLGDLQPRSILDLCTGSGCIGIFCAKQFLNASVDLSDISPKALEVAKKNVALHNCSDRVQVIESDLFENLEGRKYDIIISNPPYVDQQEMADLPEEFRHEPELALASGSDGLDITREILKEASQYLTENGLLIVEVGYSWPALVKQFPDVPFTWLKFERGGEGVFLLTQQALQDSF